jgi:hypothetical protein
MTGLPLFDLAPSDVLTLSKIPASPVERQIFELIEPHRGHKQPISIAAIHTVTGLSERAIKDAVFELVVTHKVMIGASRGHSAGYYLVETSEDQELAARPYEAQIIAMLRRLKVLKSPHKLREFLGQQVADLS